MGHVAPMGDRRVTCRALEMRLWGKKPLGRPRRREECDIKINILLSN